MPQIIQGVQWAPNMQYGGNYLMYLPQRDGRYMMVDLVILEIQEECGTCTVSILDTAYVEAEEVPAGIVSVADLRKQQQN